MKKTKLTRSLLAACSIVALTAVMYGCVHSGDGPSQAELDAEAARAAAAEQAAKDAEAAQAAAEQQAAALQTQINGLRMQLGLEADDDLGDDIADLQAEVERLQAALQARIDAANAVAAQAASDAAKALLPVLANGTVNLTDPADPTSAPVHTVPAPMLSVSNDGMLMAEATGYTMADMAPDMIEGWRGAMLAGNVGTAAEGDAAVVYSDIGNDGTQTLLDRYDSNLPNPATGTPRAWPVTGDGNIPWTAVERPDDETMVSGGTVTAPTLTFMGTVHNVPGTFSCTGSTCAAPARYSDDSVETAASGDNAAVGSWTFVPDEGALTYTDDPNYLTFGWWLSKGLDGKADDLVLIAPAAEGMDARTETSTAGTALRGSATYKGAAAGKYAIASLTSDMHEGGHFTAMATLTADFDADDTPVAGEASDRAGIALSGMIDNFMTGDTARPDWMVKLMVDGDTATDGMQPVNNLGSGAAGDLAAATVALTTEWSTGGAQKGTGTWTATFYGGDNDPTDGAASDVAANTAHPLAAVGTFNAHIGTTDATDTGAVGRMQGAFGVNKMDE